VLPELGAIHSRLKKASAHLVLDAIFIGACFKKLKLLVDSTCKTAWTDGVHLGFNPEWIATLTDSELLGLLFHEVLHVTNGHSWRRNGRDPEKWNDACDYAINPILVASGYQIPEHGLLDAKYSGKSAEYIYNIRQQEEAASSQTPPPPTPSSKEGKDDGAESKPKSGEDGDAKPGESDAAGKPDAGGKDGTGKGSKDAKDKDQKGGKGSGQGGEDSKDDATNDAGDGASGAKPKDPGKDDAAKGKDGGKTPDPTPEPKKPRPAGEVRDAPSGTNLDKLEAEWKITIDQAAKAAQMMGKFPGALAEMVPKVLKPKVDWRAVLRLFFEQSNSAQDYTWQLPNTRYLSQGLYMPRLRSERIRCIVLAEDISASVPSDMKSAFRAEERVIIEEMAPEEVHMMYCDAAVRRHDVFMSGDDVKLITIRAGGTDFRPVFELIEKEGLDPVALVYLTDLEGIFPAEPPPYPVLWVCPPTTLMVPFGDLVEMRD
jgi:predicted metal-dependent peptidase